MENNFDSVIGYYSNHEIATRFEKKRLANQRYKLDNPEDVLAYCNEKQLCIGGDALLRALISEIYDARISTILANGIGEQVIDLGCGSTFPYRFLFNGILKRKVEVTGYDISAPMLDWARKRIDEQLERAKKESQYKEYFGIYIYLNALGAETVSIEPPPDSFSINTESLNYLKDHLELRDVYTTSLESETCDSITALTGPLCYYNLNIQEQLLEKICAAARHTAVVQVKSSDYALLANTTFERNIVGQLVQKLFECESVEQAISKFYQVNMIGQVKTLLNSDRVNRSKTLFHHGQHFDIYLTSEDEIKRMFDKNNFEIQLAAGLGFLIALYPTILISAYRSCHGKPGKLLEFYRIMKTVEDAFCDHIPSLSENYTVLASRKRLPKQSSKDAVDQKLDLRESVDSVFKIYQTDAIPSPNS